MKKTKNPLIFVVQDSPIFKNLIINHLKQKKFSNIQTFSHSEECLKAIHQKPDIIILNYYIEGMTGLELMKRVQSDHPEIDFIFLSGQNDVEIAVNIMKMGAADYIVKNDKAPANLVKSIEYLISSTRSRKVKKGFQIGVIGFFILLFLTIMIIILLTVFLEDFKL